MRRRVNLLLLALGLACPLLGCGPQGLAPRAQLRPLPRLPTVRARGEIALRPSGYYRFTKQEWRQLDRTPCRFDPRSDRAARLYRRGFSKAEILQACRDVRPNASGDPRYLEHLAVWRRSGLPLTEFDDFRGTGQSITEYYNREKIGGRAMAIGGWILTGIGLALWTGAAAVMISYRIREDRCLANARPFDDLPCDHDGGRGWGAFLASMAQLGVGTLFLAPGMPLAVIGHARRRRWLRGEVLDVGHVHDLDTFRLRNLQRRGRRTIRASVAPLITRGGGGLSFRLQW